MKTLTVNLPGRSYDIILGNGLLSRPEQWFSRIGECRGPIMVVSDDQVWRHYGEAFVSACARSDIEAASVIVAPGESSKSLDALNKLYQAFASVNLNRDGLIVALGGGVVGDLAGFAAATWMRGVAYIQVPTTLLAQVDSSVGGKTALNLSYGKNIIGAFHQPQLVVIDPETLKTLPPREIGCGLSEVIKYGSIRSAELFETLEASTPSDLTETIFTCCAIKADIVVRDEFDHGDRVLLNFGHSFGHALESYYDYQRFNHGEAVGLGMIIAARLGESLGLTEAGTGERIVGALKANRLDTDIPCSPLDLLPRLAADKKSRGRDIQLVLLKKIGKAFVKPVSFEELEQTLRRMEER